MKDTLERLCMIVDERLEKVVDALEREDGKLSMEDAKYIDLLTHTQKSIKTTMAMEGYGSSERRGRDSMGRYTSRDGSYRSYDGEDRSMTGGEMKEKVRRMMDDTDDERVKRALRSALHQM